MERKGDWITTYSGEMFYPIDPLQAEVEIRDIARALSMKCRFGGMVNHFYSVAQHSVMVSMLCSTDNKLCGLLHDAAEAYFADVPTPIKQLPEMEFYRNAEQHMQDVINMKFGLPLVLPDEVHQADLKMRLAEAKQLFNKIPAAWHKWADGIEPYEGVVYPLYPLQAETEFLNTFRSLI